MTPKQYLKQFVKIYDLGDGILNRYAAVYTSEVYNPDYTGLCQSRLMSADPYTGFGQIGCTRTNRRLGKRIQLKDLPPKCQELVMSDIAGILGDYK